MIAAPPTVADLRRVGRISSQEIVAAIDAYMHNPSVGPYEYASGHRLDIAAAVASAVSPEDIARRSGPHEKTFRVAIAMAVMAARPNPA